MLFTSSLGLSATKDGSCPLIRKKERMVDKISYIEAMLDDIAARPSRSGSMSEGKIERD